MTMGTLVNGLIKAEMIGLVTPALITELAVMQQNIHTSHSVIANEDITPELLERMKYVF